MKLHNTTKIDNDVIRALVRFAKPADVSNFDLGIKNTPQTMAGTAYHDGCAYHATSAPLVICRIGKPAHFPHHLRGGKGYLPFFVWNQTEGLLFLLAHELRHLWQDKHPRGYRVWGARGQFSERDADAYAIRKVREWRKETP